MMTEASLVDGILEREGDHYEEPPKIDQPTACGGITAASLAEDRGWPVSAITKEMLKAIDVPEAKAIIGRRIQRFATSYGFNRVAFEPMRVQLIDFAYNSGADRAIRWLQRTIGLPEALVTGKFDDRTWAALARFPPVLVNNALAASRAHAAWHGRMDEKFAAGVAHRAIEFVIDTVGDVDGETL
jgi:lysozyme family protein